MVYQVAVKQDRVIKWKKCFDGCGFQAMCESQKINLIPYFYCNISIISNIKWLTHIMHAISVVCLMTFFGEFSLNGIQLYKIHSRDKKWHPPHYLKKISVNRIIIKISELQYHQYIRLIFAFTLNILNMAGNKVYSFWCVEDLNMAGKTCWRLQPGWLHVF